MGCVCFQRIFAVLEVLNAHHHKNHCCIRWMALPEDMDLSDTCDECGSDNLKSISEEEGFEKIKSKAGE